MRKLDRLLIKSRAGIVRLDWTRREGWLAEQYGSLLRLPPAPQEAQIEQRVTAADATAGHTKASHLYGDTTRRPNQVRSNRMLGRFFADLVRRRQPETVIEFGSAFGVSGMYFTAALEAVGRGHLYSFEMNQEWAKIAGDNMAAIGDRYTLTVGTFEDDADLVEDVGLAFIDAVHTREWVMPQFDLVIKHCRPGALVLFDDIDFSAEMREVWTEVATDPRVAGSVAVSDHVGVVQLH